jgi:hypothetical protein
VLLNGHQAYVTNEDGSSITVLDTAG